MKMFLLVEPVGVEPACRSDRYNFYAPAACSTVRHVFSGVLLSHKVIDMTWEMLQVHEARLVRGQLCTPTSQHRAGPVRAIYLLTLLLLFYYFYITSTGQV